MKDASRKMRVRWKTKWPAAFQEHVLRLATLEQQQKTVISKVIDQTHAFRVVANVIKVTHALYRNMSSQINALKIWKKAKIERDKSRRGLLIRMTRQMLKINKLVMMNACETSKCENGGTCIPRIGAKFFCLCPPHFTGQRCESDVDECEEYQGTDAGCQNNGTCVNTKGGFQCTCREGFHGPLCQYEMSSCSRTYELCGPHGQCIDVDAPGSKTKYKCICDWGFKLSPDLQNPTCIDVNECESNPCHPGVDCINLPGSFQCSGCPRGFRSEGSTCVDIDECAAEGDSPCDPLVKCINTVGSFECEDCPPGFDGDGTSCVKEDVCANNRCHSLSKCKETPEDFSETGRPYRCFCPDGYVGDGIGEDGCTKSNTTACLKHKCMNSGKCKPLDEKSYTCECTSDFIGKLCQTPAPCTTNNPCENEGTCVAVNGVAHCRCQENFYGDRCELQEQDSTCGRHFSESEGNYTFTHDFSNTSSICDFVFDVSAPTSSIKITFTSFDNFTAQGPGSTDCSTTLANLTLYDGGSDNARVFSTFCGDRHSNHNPLIDVPMTMTSSDAMLRFRGKQGTFSLSWKVVPRQCSYRTSKPVGVLTVPQNKQDISCEWFISAPAQQVIEVEIPAVVMHSRSEEDCSKNELEVFDGYSSYDLHRIVQICSSTETPQTVRSTGPYLSVSFISNLLESSAGLETLRGFAIKYKFVDPDRKCGGDIINSNQDFDFSGSIESPNYGSLYPPNMDCTWKIDGSLGSNETANNFKIKLTFDEFDVPSAYETLGLEPYSRFSARRYNPFGSFHGPARINRLLLTRYYLGMSCSNDYLKIYDDEGTQQYDACNPHKPPDSLKISDSKAVLRFHSNGAVQGRGFKIQYELVCENVYSGNGTIQTWNYPSGGSAGKCTYIIQAPRTHAISIRFLTIGLRVLPMSKCFYATPGDTEKEKDNENYIEIEGGRTDNILFNRKYFCTKYPFVEDNWMSVSAVKPLKITVSSDGHKDNKGLSIQYKTADVGCGGLFSSVFGTIQSPNWPEKYMPHMHCVYDIYVSWTKAVKLSFDAFDLEVTTSTNCEYDRVEVYTSYHNETVHGELIGKFCGSMLPPVVFSPTNSMSLVFVSDRSVAGQGFSAKYEAIDKAETCDKTFTSPSGQIVFNATNNRFDKCLFHIAVREDEKILLKMNNMSIPCDKSKLQIRNGPGETSPPFASLFGESEVCDIHPMPNIRSFSSRILLIFTSTDSRSTFFNISYEVVANGCGGRVDGLAGSVAAPQYPLTDRRNLKCDWTIAVALGNKVRFTVVALDELGSADEQGFCPDFSANRLDVLDSSKQGSRLLKRYCKKELAIEPINSDDNEIELRYIQSGGFRSGKIFGFMGHFTTICTGIVHTALSGSIQSPGYPHKVYGNQYCQWTIQVPKGNRIAVKIHHFNIQKQYSYLNVCDRSLLKVDDTDLLQAEVKIGNRVNTTTSINKFCDKAIPLSFESRHNTMKLTYTSERMPTNQFWLSWSTIGCSGTIQSPQTIQLHPGLIDQEANDFECHYRIQAPLGKKIRLVIESLSIHPTSTSNCVYSPTEQYHGVAIFMGSSNSSGVAQMTFCEEVRNQTYLSHSDEMFLYFALQKDYVKTTSSPFFKGRVEFLDTNTTDPADACGGIIDLEVGKESSITSPGFPAPYPVGVSCRWLFKAPDGYHINYTLQEYHSPNHHAEKEIRTGRWMFSNNNNLTCRSSLSFSDGMLTIHETNSSDGQIVERYCEESTADQIKSAEVFSSESLVTFIGATNLIGRKSGEDVKERNGFLLTAKPICGGVVFAESVPQTISMYHQGEESCSMVVRKKDPMDSNVFISIESYSRINSSIAASHDDRIVVTVDGRVTYTERLKLEDTSMSEYSAEDKIKIKVDHAQSPSSAIITYSTNERACGGTVRHQNGKIYEPIRSFEKPIDCQYLIENTLGNFATIQVLKHNLVATPNCTGSYIEIREEDGAGKILKRQCDGDSVDTTEYRANKLWLYFRYRPAVPSRAAAAANGANGANGNDDEDENDDDDDDASTSSEVVPNRQPTFEIKYSRGAGGLLDEYSNFIEKPYTEQEETTTWLVNAKAEDKGITILFLSIYLPNPTSYLKFYQVLDNVDEGEEGDEEDEIPAILEAKGVLKPSESFLPYTRIRIVARYKPDEDFRIFWSSGSHQMTPTTTAKTPEQEKFDCGGELTATWGWNYITNSLPAGQTHGYEENLHCRWSVQSPELTGLELEFEYLDLENDESCQYDYVAFLLSGDDGEDPSEEVAKQMRHCSLAKSSKTFKFETNRFLYIHFVTDRSRHGNGFKLKFRLSCNSFYHVPKSLPFEMELTSPNYANSVDFADRSSLTCQWSILLESNRRIEVSLVDLDIVDEEPCGPENRLLLGNHVSALYRQLLKSQNHLLGTFCGSMDANQNITFTTAAGRLFIRYQTSQLSRKGFKLRMREVFTSCPSGVLQLDENHPKRTIYSPGYPAPISHSADCEYLMAAPNGHRIMLTFDPDYFDLEKKEDDKDKDKGCSDYVEVRDGPSRLSNLIGRFCGTRPPSTIYSTSNFLSVFLHTDQYIASGKFKFDFEIATCGGTIIVNENSTTHITSPNFPDPFQSPIQCVWNIRSPSSHMLLAKIEHLWLFYNVNCTTESLAIMDGNSTAPALIKPICNPRNAPDVWTRSSSNQMTVVFNSTSMTPKAGRQYCPSKKCGFEISIKLSETKCGGVITSARGVLTTPGFPNRLLPNVRCRWVFHAKPGFIWLFKFNFTDRESYHLNDGFSQYFDSKKACFGDLRLQTETRPDSPVYHGEKFCANQSTLTSIMDMAQILYDDSATRDLLSRSGQNNHTEREFYHPFTVEYSQIRSAQSASGCSYLVNSNQTMSFTGSSTAGKINVTTNCHVVIEKPQDYGTAWIKIEDYHNSETLYDTGGCTVFQASIRVRASGVVPMDKTICNINMKGNSTEFVVVNNATSIYINQPIFHKQETQNFNLTVEFQNCGGIITEPSIGAITSPIFGPSQKYVPNSRCRWILTAPEGQVVELKITEMNIEYDHDCMLDYLIIGEGKESEINTIHKYCHQFDGKDEKKLEDRFKTIRSSGRHLTVLWSTNEAEEESGWKIEYEFVNEQDTCGFHTRGMSGVIHTTKFGEADYENDLECVWDIQAPLGYHIEITFENFDVETSASCEKDSLVISEEHSSRAESPMGNYYFLFKDEEKQPPLCGVETPNVFESESNRVRLNFTTDGETAGRGFKLSWRAVCGAVFRLNHGVVTSPMYPTGYPNLKQECGYFIYPPDDQPNAVIALQVVDFDLSDQKNEYARYPCEQDYLQIVDPKQERVLYNACGGTGFTSDTFTVKGGVALKFVTSHRQSWADPNPVKNNRGFRITYAINKCGGDFELKDGQLTNSVSSPAFPLQYQHSLDCIYNITTSFDRVISAKFEFLSMENMDDCSADYVELFNGAEPSESNTLGKFCGTKERMPNYRIRSSGPNMIIKLVTDALVTGGGFKIIVSATLGERSDCGGKLTATNEWKTLRSPQDDDGNYPGSLQCGWTITGPLNTQLQLRLDNIDTEPLTYPPGDRPIPECIDSLAIYDGQERFSPILANDICTSETTPPSVLFTSHRHAFIYFETDEDGTGKGFNISYRTLQADCGGWLEADAEMKTLLFKSKIAEENEHKGEKTRQRCRYMISGSKTAPIVVNFKEFRILSPSGDCTDAYVEISDVGSLENCHHPGCARYSHQRKVIRNCGSNIPPPHISNTNVVQIIVSAEIETTNRSILKIEYQSLTDCNRTVDTTIYKSGLLQSPNYPNQYSVNTTCTTKLQTHGKKILISFLKNFMLEHNSHHNGPCEYDYLEINDGEDSTKYCGTSVPPSVLSSGNDVTTVFKSDHSGIYAGYSANYYTVVRETDDTIEFADSYDNEGVISNIGYPNGYNKSMTQVFTIRPPFSHNCRIIFDEVSLGITDDKQNCLAQDEYLRFDYRYKGVVNSVRIRDCTFGRNQAGKVYVIRGDDENRYLKFTFKSDEKTENDGRGFKMSWSCDNFSADGKKISAN